MTTTGSGVTFEETQRFIQRWLWILVVLLMIAVWVMSILWFGSETKQRSLSSDIIVIVSWVLVGACIPVLLLVMKLETEVRRDGLYVRLFPFHLEFRRFAWPDVKESRARRYNPIREYGGWGIRWGRGGRAYNMRGDRGLQLVMKDGKRWLIGSQRADELAAAVDKAMGLTGERSASS